MRGHFAFLQDLCKYARGELKGELEIGTIQTIIRHGIDREELRDEIFVQCVRQINNNPSGDQASRLWLLLCLVVVAFPPGKSFFKVSLEIRAANYYVYFNSY